MYLPASLAVLLHLEEGLLDEILRLLAGAAPAEQHFLHAAEVHGQPVHAGKMTRTLPESTVDEAIEVSCSRRV
jgi:hypothetical protein